MPRTVLSAVRAELRVPAPATQDSQSKRGTGCFGDREEELDNKTQGRLLSRVVEDE